MIARKFLIQSAYYYLLLSTTAVIFLFVTTLNSVFGGRNVWQAPWFNESNRVAALFWGLMLVDQLIGLFVIILLRRMHTNLATATFIFLYLVQFLFFIAPSFVSILLAILTSGRV